MSAQPSSQVFFFGGADPAPSEGNRSDDGAIVTLRAALRPGLQEITQNEMDYDVDVVHAIRYTHKQKLSSREWSGEIHRLNRAFQWSQFCMDYNGGGVFIMRDLASARQIISGIEQTVTPIATPDQPLVSAHFILSLFKRGDSGIDELWPELAGDDVLNDHAYSTLKVWLDNARLGMVRPEHEWSREQMAGWNEERVWALRNLWSLQKQLVDILVATKDDGTYAFTKRNARTFSSKGKKDFVSALIYALVAFLVWLKRNPEVAVNAEDASGFGGFGGTR